MHNRTLMQHIENKRPQAWTWGKKDTYGWLSAFRHLMDDNTDYSGKVLAAMLNDADFVKHAAVRFEYWSTILVSQRDDVFVKFLKELSQRHYQPNVLVGEILLYSVRNKSYTFATQFIQSNCVTPIHLQEFGLLEKAVQYSLIDQGGDLFNAIWRKGGSSVQGLKTINPTVKKLMEKHIKDWNPVVVDKLLPKINSASLRKYFKWEPVHITNRLEHIIALHEQMVLSKRLLDISKISARSQPRKM